MTVIMNCEFDSLCQRLVVGKVEALDVNLEKSIVSLKPGINLICTKFFFYSVNIIYMLLTIKLGYYLKFFFSFATNVQVLQ